MDKIEQQIEEYSGQISELYDKINLLKRERSFICNYCKKKTKLKKLTLIERQEYDDDPYCGHTPCGTSYKVLCPKCGNINYSHSNYKKKDFINDNVYNFGKVEEIE